MTNPAAEIDRHRLVIPSEGVIAEFGCYDGSSMKTLVNRFPGREFWAFDTFEGMPPAHKGYEPSLDGSNPPGKFRPKLSIEADLNNLGVKTIKGVYCDKLPVQQEPKQVALAYLDCDWYTSVRDVLGWLETRLVPSAIVLFDDYNLAGCKKAVDEWKEKHNQVFCSGRYIIWGNIAEVKPTEVKQKPIKRKEPVVVTKPKATKKTLQYKCGHCRPRF